MKAEASTNTPGRPVRRRWGAGAIIALALGLTVELALLAAAAGLMLLLRSDAILPGVHSLGLDLGWLTQAQATVALLDAWQSRPVILDTGADGAWKVAPDAAGLRLDAEATATRAYAVSRSPDDLEGLQETLIRDRKSVV